MFIAHIDITILVIIPEKLKKEPPAFSIGKLRGSWRIAYELGVEGLGEVLSFSVDWFLLV